MQEQEYRAPGGRRDSTRSITANEQNVRQMACVLLCDEEPVSMALLGEPLAEALSMVMWALAHEGEPGFDPAVVLPAWAKKRKRGAWREDRIPEIEQFLDTIRREATRYEQCADCRARREVRRMVEVQEEHADHHPGLSPGERMCVDCAGKHGLR